MSQFQSFFIKTNGDTNQCDELNRFMVSHTIIRCIENLVSTGQNTGIQILVEYNDNQQNLGKNNRKIDYRATLATDTERLIFDKLKEFRAKLCKEKKLVGAYMICKDEHIAAIAQKTDMTPEEIAALPHSGNIQLKDYSAALYDELLKIKKTLPQDSADETGEIPF